MLRKFLPLCLPIIFVACSVPAPQTTPQAVEQRATIPPPPATEARPVTETMHGVTITDPYRWLEDQNSPETRAWIDRQNAYTDSILGNRPERGALAARLTQLANTDEMSTPIVRGNRYFYTLRRVGEDVFSIYMREGATGKDVLLVDAAPLSPKHTTNIGIEDVTTDGRQLAYYVREGGADEVEVRFFDVDALHDTFTPLPRARYGGVSITPRAIYFGRVTAEGPRVFRRAPEGGNEELLFGNGYTRDKLIYAGVSDDYRTLLIHVLYGSAATKSEVYVKDLAMDGPIRTVVNDLPARVEAELAGDSLVLLTNWEAPNQRVFVAPLATPERANWRELVHESRTAAIQSISAAGGKVFVRYLENVVPRIDAYNLDGTRGDTITFDVLGRLDDVSGSWTQPVVFFSFSSFALPRTTYAYDVAQKSRTVFWRNNAPVDPNAFVVEQAFATSKDGTRVPMFIFYKKGLKRDGRNPAFLTGYGGFNSSQLPGFSTRAISLAENGAVYALADMRGGGEYGEAWHRAGMLEKKQNVFDDFYAAAQYLIDSGYTSREHLGIGGTSNGGLLVTAAATQRPDLFKAVVCGYPLIDMLRYDQFLVAGYWVPEYGSAKDPEQFKWIYAYSPYQHVVPGTKYPAMLFISGDADTRVAPLHARKMTALMQADAAPGTPVMLRYHTEGGHSGGEPLTVQVRNESEIESFLLWQLR